MKWTWEDPYKTRIEIWFAWFPVRCADDQVRWLERVVRRSVYKDSWGYDGWWMHEYFGRDHPFDSNGLPA